MELDEALINNRDNNRDSNIPHVSNQAALWSEAHDGSEIHPIRNSCMLRWKVTSSCTAVLLQKSSDFVVTEAE